MVKKSNKVCLFMILMCLLTCVLAKSGKGQKVEKAEDIEEAPLIHDYVKLAFWCITGIIVGIYYEAGLSYKSLIVPVVRYALYGLSAALTIVLVFQFAKFVNHYL